MPPNNSDPLADSRSGIEDAKRRIQEFEREVAGFVNSDPYTRVVEPNADRTEDTHKIKLTKPLPPALPGIAFEILSHLRAALDRAGYAAAIAAGKSGDDAHFPFGGDEPSIRGQYNAGKGRSKDIPKEIFDVMMAFEPDKRRNGALWALNELCNTDKHEVVLPVVHTIGNTTLNQAFFGSTGKTGLISWPPKWDSAKNEMILGRIAHGAAFRYDLTFHMLVMIGEVEGVPRQEAASFLNALLGEVERSLVAIETEARRIGLFN